MTPISPKLPPEEWGHKWHRWADGRVCIVHPDRWDISYTARDVIDKVADWYFNYLAYKNGLIGEMPDVGRAVLAREHQGPMICLRIVIPETLGKLSLDAGTRGWFGGSGVAREYLAVIRDSRVGEGEPIYAPGSARLFDHWAFFNGSESNGKIVQWVSVRRGFGFALAYSESVRKEELTDWITDGQPPDIPDGETDSLCCLEPLEEGGTRVHLLVVFKDGSVTSGSVQTISAEPRLPARLDGLRTDSCTNREAGRHSRRREWRLDGGPKSRRLRRRDASPF